MIISQRHRFIFIKTLKTAGTSLEVYLSDVCGDEDVVTPIYPPVAGHRARNYRGLFNPLPEVAEGRGRGVRSSARSLWRGERFRNHLPAYKARARISRRIWEQYTTFCVERNPWDKTLSHYHMVAKREGGGLTLDRYLDRGALCYNYNSWLPLHAAT